MEQHLVEEDMTCTRQEHSHGASVVPVFGRARAPPLHELSIHHQPQTRWTNRTLHTNPWRFGMKFFGFLLVCVGVLAFAPASEATPTETPIRSVTEASVPATDPFLAMSEITTHVNPVEACPSGQIDPRCEHGPSGEDCSTVEQFWFCHCTGAPTRLCVKNP